MILFFVFCFEVDGRLLVWTFEAGRHTPLIQIVRQEDTPLIWVTPSVVSLYKEMEDGNFCSLHSCPHPASTSVPSMVLEIPEYTEYTEDQLRLPVW